MKQTYKTKQRVSQEPVKLYKEGIHYYIEGERVIFTALFHIQRGQCCGNGCRHCPYEPKYTKGKVVLAKKYNKFKDMDLKEIEKQLQELQKVDFSTMSPEQLQKVVNQLLEYTTDAETQLNNDIQTQIDELDEPEDS